MKRIRLGLLLLITSLSVPVTLAHSNLNKSVPENGAIVDFAPTVLELEFTKDLRLTKVEMINGEGSEPLDLSTQKAFSKNFSLPFPSQASGSYEINWRGLSKDGHVMKGMFSFEVK